MRRAYICLLLCFSCLQLTHAQEGLSSPVFQVDSLTKEGLLLNQGWKWQKGDNLAWANASFNDKQWQIIDPTRDVMNLPKVREAGISWFRLHLHLDSSLIKQTLTLVVNQTVASEIYLNGRLLRRLGRVKATSQKAEAQFTTLTQISFQADNRSQQLLAVRVAFEKGIPYQKLGGVWNQNHLLQVYLLKESDIDEFPLGKMIRNSILIDSFKGGLFFIMFFLHLAFFAFYPLRKANLFFAATTLCFSLDALTTAMINGGLLTKVAVVEWIQLVIVPLYPLGYFFLLLALFIIFGPVKGYFYSLLGIWLIVTLLILFASNEQGLQRMFLSTILLNLVALAMTIVATLKKQEGSRIIFWGMTCSFIAFGMAFLSPDSLVVLLNINQSNSLFLLLFNMAAVSIPLSISLFLANEFATLHKGLAKQLKEVQHLSQLTLAQQEEKRQLQHLDTLKGRFFANLSHEFRTPLSLILGTVEKLQGESAAAPHMQADLGRVKENADKLLGMINQLLELSKLEAGKLELHPQVAELSGFLKCQAGVFIDLFKNKKISYHYTLPLLPVWVWMDREKLELMISNLLSNAYKFTPAQGEVHFSASIAEVDATQVSLLMIVQDTGIGISTHQLPHIFDRFYQADSTATRSFEGTGIGLSLVKELLEMLGGSIRVESQKGQGSTFTLQIPLQAAAQEAIEKIVEKDVALAYTLADASVEEEGDGRSQPVNKKPQILLVEDNQELRHFLKQSLSNAYRVMELEDGLLAYKRAQEIIPDLIISDIMMPGMDGIMLSHKLKSNEQTSHIPIILLTAKADMETKLEGLQTGADDYLTKPFQIAELHLRINNLLEARKKLREKFNRQLTLQPGEIEVTSMDERFLQKALSIMEENLANADFDVEAFCREMGMGRTQLHNKLSALLNQSATEFIRSMRMKRAANLLHQQGGNVSEIAFQVGFSSPNYFAKCFREFYGLTPSQYARGYLPSDPSQS